VAGVGWSYEKQEAEEKAKKARGVAFGGALRKRHAARRNAKKNAEILATPLPTPSPTFLPALTGFAAGCWGAASCSFASSVAVQATNLATVLGFAGIIFYLTCRFRPTLRIFFLLLLLWGCLGFGLAGRAHVGVIAKTVQRPSSTSSEGVVASDTRPQVLRTPQGRWLLRGVDEKLVLGARVRVQGVLRPVRGDLLRHRRLHYSRVTGEISVESLTIIAPAPFPARVAEATRDHLRRAAAHLSHDRAGLLLGLLIGDDSRLSRRKKDDFRAAGMSHLIAVSGGNLVFVIAAATFLARVLMFGRRARLFVAGSVMAFYVLLTRAEPSIVRAATMSGLSLLASWFGISRDIGSILLCTVLGLGILDPFLFASPAFQLSVSATAGVLWGTPLLSSFFSRHLGFFPLPLRSLLSAATAAQAAVFPVAAWHFQEISLVGVVANLFAVPLAGIVTLGGATSALFAVRLPWVFDLLIPPLHALLWMSGKCASLPGSRLFLERDVLLALGAVGTGVYFLRGVLRRRAAFLVGAVFLGVTLFPQTQLYLWAYGLRACPGIRFLQVGQGDAALVRGAQGEIILVDTGPSPRVLRQGLRRAGVGRIDLLVLTHDDLDHIGGLRGLGGIKIGSALIPVGMPWATEGARAALRLLHDWGVEIREGARGDQGQVGAVSFLVLHPSSFGYMPPARKPARGQLWPVARGHFAKGDLDGKRLGQKAQQDAPGISLSTELGSEMGARTRIETARIAIATGQSPRKTKSDVHFAALDDNDASLVLVLRVQNLTVALLADVGSKGQTQIRLGLPARGIGPVDVVKIPHHGARSQDPQLVALLSPSVSVVSTGLNTYGHPTPSALALYKRYGEVYRTDMQGDIVICASP